ncbi:MAG: PAS domain S-box protein [Bacteroidota bacterium]
MSKLLRVLVVEDSAVDAELVLHQLRRGGYDPDWERVETAGTMKSALKEKTWDVILCDYSMPRFDAIDALKILHESGLDIPFIIVSGTIGEDVAVKAMKSGAHDYIMKDKLARLVPAIERELKEAEVRRKAEKAEEELRNLSFSVEHSPVTVIIADKKGDIEYVNRKFAQLTGYSSGEVIGKNPRILQSGKHSPEFYKDLWDTITSGKIWRGEFCNKKKNGKVYWESASISPIKDTKKKITHFIAIKEDITERKKAEKALLESEANYKELANSITDVFFAMDIDLRYTYWNKASEILTSIKAEDAIGKSIFEIFPDNKETRKAVKVYQEVLKKQHHNIFINEYDLEGRKYFFEINAYPSKSGLSVFVKDITEQKTTEEKLRLSDNILREVRTLVLVTNNKGDIVYCSPSVKRMTGYDPGEILGDGWWKLTFEDKKDGEQIRNRIVQYADDRKQLYADSYERKTRCKDGKEKWFMYYLSKGLDGLVISVGHDINKIKKIEEELKIKNRELNTFIYKASHDLRGPFSSISGIINLAKKNINDPASREYMDLIDISTQRLDNMLSDLLQVSVVMQGVVEKKPINIKKIVNEVVESLKHSPQAKDIDFRFKFYQRKKLYSDRRLLRSVFQNLIDNAIKFKKNIMPFVEIKTVDLKEGVKIEVSDNSGGIPGDLQDKVFNMFFRGNEKSKGTGLGLYIVKTNIEKLGGTVKMKSEPGKGTRFTIFLPG